MAPAVRSRWSSTKLPVVPVTFGAGAPLDTTSPAIWKFDDWNVPAAPLTPAAAITIAVTTETATRAVRAFPSMVRVYLDPRPLQRGAPQRAPTLLCVLVIRDRAGEILPY